MRGPRYVEKERTSRLIPNQRAAANKMAISVPTAVVMFDPFQFGLKRLRAGLAPPRFV
jgi:hypothetical protein